MEDFPYVILVVLCKLQTLKKTSGTPCFVDAMCNSHQAWNLPKRSILWGNISWSTVCVVLLSPLVLALTLGWVFQDWLWKMKLVNQFFLTFLAEQFLPGSESSDSGSVSHWPHPRTPGGALGGPGEPGTGKWSSEGRFCNVRRLLWSLYFAGSKATWCWYSNIRAHTQGIQY